VPLLGSSGEEFIVGGGKEVRGISSSGGILFI